MVRPGASGERISITVDGQLVVGEVFAKAHDMTVRILDGSGFESEWHIPYFARSKVSFDGSQRYETALAVLGDLHKFSEYVRTNFDSLRDGWRNVSARVQEISRAESARDSFPEFRRELRRRLRAGEMSQRDYQSSLSRHRQVGVAFEAERAILVSEYFERSFPFIVGDDLRDQLIARFGINFDSDQGG